MKNLLLCLCLLPTTLFAESILCQAKSKGSVVWEKSVNLDNRQVVVGEVEHVTVYLGKKAQTYSIEVLDPYAEARHYAEGGMTPNLSWAIWTRNYLIEVNCIKR